jgi:tetratricopeptide (TPR) repeat protein
MYCSACGKRCPDGAAYCAWCGTKLPELATEQAMAAEVADESAPELPADEELSGEAPAGEGAKEPPVKPEPEQLDLDFDALAEEPDDPLPEKPAGNSAHHAFQRPLALHPRADDAQTVRPLAANPAQPLRGAEAAAVASVGNEPEETLAEEPDEADELDEADEPDLADAPAPKGGGKPRARDDFDDEWVRPAAGRDGRRGDPAPARPVRGEEKPAKRSLFGRGDGKSAKPSIFGRINGKSEKRPPYDREDERPAKRSPYDREDERPAKRSPYEREDERSAKRSPYEREAQRPLKRVSFDPDDDMPPKVARAGAERPKPSQGSARGKAVTASGGMVTPPARRSPAKPSGPLQPRKQPRKDLFFEDLEMPRENFYDEAAEDRALSRRIKAIVAIALAVGVLMVTIWLTLTPGGQIVRAQLNLGAPASAYKALGDQDLSGGQVQRAADAYYSALKLDPDNYEYAMLVGKTQEMVGDRDAAIKAYMVCVKLKETAVEPYVRLRDLYKVRGDDQMAENWRAEGYAKTGDATLAPGA